MLEEKAEAVAHMHTYYSDGSDSPREMVRKIKEKSDELEESTGVVIKGATKNDHNTFLGEREFLEACKEFGVNGLNGIELSTQHPKYPRLDVHILLYKNGPLSSSQERLVSDALKSCEEMYLKRAESALSLYAEKGIMNVTLEDIRKVVGVKGPSVVPYHLSLYRHKVFGISMKEAMAETARGGVARVGYLDNYLMTPVEAVKLGKAIGAKAVFAHPGELFKRNDGSNTNIMEIFSEMLDETCKAGLFGMEAVYVNHTVEQNKLFTQITKERGLFITSGLDYHGTNTPERQLGTFGMPYANFLELQRACS